jgi:cytochrome c oxidase assembly protein subunit 15
MVAFLAVVLGTIGVLRRQRAPAQAFHLAHTLLTVLVLQAAVGYTQYFTDVPPLLVGLHILGACLVWVAVLRFRLGLSSLAGRPRQSTHDQPGGAHHRTGGDLVTHR